MDAPKIANQIIELIRPLPTFRNIIQMDGNALIVGNYSFDLQNYEEVAVVGLGKGASIQVRDLLTRLDELGKLNLVKRAIVYTKTDHRVSFEFPQVQVVQYEGEHPVPTLQSFATTQNFIGELKKINSNSLVLFCLSGGASALLMEPSDGVGEKELLSIYHQLSRQQWPIEEINVIRGLLSNVKNGGLLDRFNFKKFVNLIFNDIPSGQVHLVGSGPTIHRTIDEVDFKKAQNHLAQISSIKLTQNNKTSLDVAEVYNCEAWNFSKLMNSLKELFPEAAVIEKAFNDPIDDLIKIHLDTLKSSHPAQLISGGEALVQVSGSGLGGRNTHFVALMARALYQNEDLRDYKVLSFGTDGTDGPTDAAGAHLDFYHYQKLENELQEALDNFDTYHLFKRHNLLYRCRDTGNNLMDVRFIFR